MRSSTTSASMTASSRRGYVDTARRRHEAGEGNFEELNLLCSSHAGGGAERQEGEVEEAPR